MPPLVSVMTPAYNATKTLPMALASLQAQEFRDWECLLVDDGSTDRPELIVEMLGDTRIRYIRLDSNHGRGVARQVALEHARGEYLTFLDADDWIYPEKLRVQLEAFSLGREIALVSMGMAIVDEQINLVGVRRHQIAPYVIGQLTRPSRTPVAYVTAMVRMDIAKQARYSQSLLRAQDMDFILQVLMGRSYCLLHDIGYAYYEWSASEMRKTIDTLRYEARILWSYRMRYPFASVAGAGIALAKVPFYAGAFRIGIGNRAIQRRSAPGLGEDLDVFCRARQEVVMRLDQIYQTIGGRPSSAAHPGSQPELPIDFETAARGTSLGGRN